MPLDFSRLAIPDLILIVPQIFEDTRGFFLEIYKHMDFAAAGIPEHFVQANYSRSESGSRRTMLKGSDISSWLIAHSERKRSQTENQELRLIN